MYDMFRKYGIKIEMEDLADYFKITDDNHDDALNLQEFIKCAVWEPANEAFKLMMRKVRERHQSVNEERKIGVVQKRQKSTDQEADDKKDKLALFIPMSFRAMITYVCYEMARERFLDDLFNKELPVEVHFDRVKKLYRLNQHTEDLFFNNEEGEHEVPSPPKKPGGSTLLQPPETMSHKRLKPAMKPTIPRARGGNSIDAKNMTPLEREVIKIIKKAKKGLDYSFLPDLE